MDSVVDLSKLDVPVNLPYMGRRHLVTNRFTKEKVMLLDKFSDEHGYWVVIDDGEGNEITLSAKDIIDENEEMPSVTYHDWLRQWGYIK